MNPVVMVMTLTSNSMFEPGQHIVVSGLINSGMGGSWPRWTRRLHIPERILFFSQWIGDRFGHKFGPRKYLITRVQHGNQITVGS